MEDGRESGRARVQGRRYGGARFVTALAIGVLLAALGSTYALADEPENVTPPPSGETVEAEVPHPDAAEIGDAFEAARRKEEERERELEEPRFAAEREASRHAYADANRTETEELLRTTFGETLAELNSDPARFLSGAKLDDSLGEGAAVVTSEGHTTLMEGALPIETANAEGELEKVDLNLEETPAGFEPENPIVETTIGTSAEEGIELGGGSEPLELVQAGAGESTGEEFGDKNVFYPEVTEEGDTDLLVSPTASGVELFDMLRSVDSPETLRFQLSLPEGASLHPVAGGGAEVQASDGSLLALIPKPSGVDAQGTYVPISLEVEGEAVVLQTHHREEDLAYPILVDPEVVYEDWQHPNWYENQRLGALSYWQWASNSGLISHPETDANWPGHRGLFIGTPSGNLPGGIYGYNYLYRNLGSYVQEATINIFYRANQGCTAPNPYPEPYDFDGLYDVAQGRWNETHFNDANKYGNSKIMSWGHEFVEGMGTASSTYIPCARDVMAGGMELWWGDWDAPELTSVTGMPSGWIKMDNTQRSIGVAAYDGGLGVKKIRLFGLGGREYNWNQSECLGTLEEACAASRSGTITYETSGSAAYEGEQTFTVQALDPVEHGYHSKQYPVKLDGLPPALTLSGQFVTATEPAGVDQLSLPTYNLKIKAKDLLSTGGTGSGVKKLKVFLDGKEVASSGPTCTSSSCPVEYEWTYPLSLNGLTEAEHTLEVRASDFVGNESKPETWLKKFEFIPATGMKEEYVLQHFLLPDGQNHSGEEYEGPELAVNVMNGNVVYRERDLKTTSQSGRNLELERIYNSQQPVARDGQWGHGWSLAQTPEFKPETAEATKAKMLQTSAVTNAVDLPKTSSETSFSTRLHATVAKTESGTYEVRSASSDETQIFNSAGRIEEARLSNISPEVTVPHEPVFPLYAESIGSPGSGNGQLSNPADVVVDAKGNTWVVDKGNNRIVEFNEAGEFIRGVGSLGSGAGQLKSPSAIAIDTWGNLDVADTGNNRVVRFSSEGAFQSVVGANVNKTKVEAGGTLAEKNRCAAGSGDVCQAGTSGSGEGLMAEPVGIATSAGDGGLFYVVERANNRVEKFNLLGELQAKFGSLGSGNGQLKEPSAIAIGPNGLWVADTGNNRIEKWSFSWVYQSQFGTAGSGNGQFKSPAAVEVDASGNVWVGDQGNQRVQELSPSGDYITQFGGEGQFQFSSPMGIFLDSAGDLWVTDSQRGQVQEWMTGSFLFAGSRIGSSGTGNSQFSHPADVALDGKGNLWALDKGNNRLEKFNEKGEFVAAVGAKGGAAGQLNAPSALAIDPSGNLWVADTANNRIEEWSEAGQFVLTFGREVNKTKAETAGATEAEKSLCTAASGNVCQAGVAGSANGQLNAPLGVATTSSGNLWVADTANNRIQKFGPTGSLINVVNGSNTPAGTMKEPAAIAMGPDGSIWVADTGNNRIEQWSTTLSLTRYFGSEGTGNGRFKRPAALDIDSEGNVWVGDQNNERIQQFTSTGEYVAQLGSSAQFAFSAPMGLAADNKGGLWLTDTDHNRVQRILTSEFAKPVVTQVPAIHYSYSGTSLTKMELKEPEAPDPAITVATTSGLATSASSEADTATYSYTSGKLTTSNDSEGETKYEYDAGNRIKKITLPNGTWASVTYDSTGRATKVIVKPAGGTEKTTNFKYEQEPRRTYVWGNEDPEVIYYFGEDGSLLKWENAATPPTIASITGSLWGHRNDPNPIENKDQTLFVTAESQNEIASIKVLSGNAVLAEQSCEDKSEPPAHNCDRPPALEWIPNPSEFPPGRLDLEIVATDFQEHSTAERFFVTMPQQPPPNPEAPEKPNFKSIKLFREENGLDRGKALTEAQSNRLILELLYEWEAQFPAAVAAVETFGVPMRTPELGEMEYRRSYLAQAAEAIPLWAEEHSPTTYGGYYVDNREGGIIYVGFTQNQSAQVEALKQSGVLNAPGQVREMPSPPTRAIVSVESLEQEVITAIAANSLVSEATEEVSMDSSSGLIEVNALAPGAVRAFLTERFGASAPISVQAISSITTPAYSRFHSTGPVHAGDWLQTLGQCEEGRGCYSACTANFGGYSQVSMLQGQPIYNWYKLTAGHCFGFGTRVKRKPNGGKATNAELASVGQLERSGWSNPNSSGNFTDFEAIHVNPELSSSEIFYGNPAGLISVNGAEHARLHREYCWSGANGSARECGIAYKRAVVSVEGHPEIGFWVLAASVSGDSGGPVWDPVTKKAVGIISGHNRISKQPCVELLPKSNKEWCPRTFIGPLLPFFGKFYPDGGLEALGVELVNWK